MNNKILIVDDCPDTCLLMQVILELNNFNVDIADNAVLGLSKIRNSPPNVVITDNMMPDMDGCEFLRCIRTSNEYDYLPVLMVSGFDEADIIANSQYKFDAFIQKPIVPNRLVEIVNKVLNLNYEANPP
ncbi:response regulator receiver signal transduction histidine kinase [Calothrix sp. NIES-4071]|nr:response regulator receiver signal transduction histidine kinase [Calothrix sp. NIES-4071]BAZ54636.1 response regulator receiver signal transduction histidine kinase [Calothrix sp. NIES-4105]